MNITPLMTSLHEGHSAEERIDCIDKMLDECIDTKFTILQAFWWYRKYTKHQMQKINNIASDCLSPCSITPTEGMIEIKKISEKL